ncbi:MAG: hypothetical protein ACRED1_07520, partial [Limisphaerales bacterium]
MAARPIFNFLFFGRFQAILVCSKLLEGWTVDWQTALDASTIHRFYEPQWTRRTLEISALLPTLTTA